jgi:hypothetical protein
LCEVPWSGLVANLTQKSVMILDWDVALLAHSRGDLVALTSGRYSDWNMLSAAKCTASDASIADDWNGDADQGRVGMCMTPDLGKEHTPPDELYSASGYHHSWEPEVPQRHYRSDICWACSMEETCESFEDLELAAVRSETYQRDEYYCNPHRCIHRPDKFCVFPSGR